MEESDGYYAQQRREMLHYMPPNISRMIDVGCGEGAFGAAVKEAFPACEVWGLEPEGNAARKAATRCDRLVNEPFEANTFLPTGYFDVVTMNDVLEHLTHTEPALTLAKSLLKPTGILIVSLPNVAYYLNIRNLVFKNDWEYSDFGILDRTHLRFFTQKSAVRVIEQNGFTVNEVHGINEPAFKVHYRALFALVPKLTKPMRYPQFAIVASPGQCRGT